MIKINLTEYFDETVSNFPERIAVIDGQRNCNFAELSSKAYETAGRLIKSSEIFKSPVGVFLNKSIESVYADIGIMYSGNFYMNLDVKYPADRLRNILALIKPLAIITNNQFYLIIKSVADENLIIINLDDVFEYNQTFVKATIKTRLTDIIDTDPACVINTSGSTGTPKGVVLNHRSFFDFTEWAVEQYHFDNNMIMGSLSPIIFDIYSFELCMLMRNAATLVVIPGTLAPFPASILKILEEQKVSFIFWVPTIMVNIANMSLLEHFPLESLKNIWFAGEVFPTKQYNYWHHHLPNALFSNLYGPIEITLDCTYFDGIREIPDDQPLPIGIPMRNTDVLILDDENNRIIKPDVEGELCVRGTSLAMGYYNNPEKTAIAFVQNPLNQHYPEVIYRTGDVVAYNEYGEIMFKGRKDNIVKHMGYRTDLGEIEHIVINTLKLVKNGCIVYNQLKKEITLYYESDKELSPQEFRKAILKQLPNYMIPTVYHKVDILQRNTNGKIDRLFYKNDANK